MPLTKDQKKSMNDEEKQKELKGIAKYALPSSSGLYFYS